jgi:radical SAM superfamily enzyme YgiQ (UPF0313 family)
LKVLLLNLPSPPGKNIERDFAGGFGVLGSRSRRRTYGHDLQKSIVLPPLMEAYAAAAIKAMGHEVAILDAQVGNLGSYRLIDAVGAGKYDLLVSRPCLPSFDGDLELIDRIHSEVPATEMSVWGATSSEYLNETLGKSVKYALLGELDQSLPILCDALSGEMSIEKAPGIAFRRNGQIHRSTPGKPEANLDLLPSPAHDLVDMKIYYDYGKIEMAGGGRGRRFFTVQSSRGCPFGCDYCPYIVEFGTRWRELSAERTVDEIELLVDEYSIEAIWFRDPTWNFNTERALSICREIVSRNIEIIWRAEMRADLVTRELAGSMKEAGCVNAQVGLETGSECLLVDKGKKGTKMEKIKMGFRELSRASIPITANVMVGLPGDNWALVRETAEVLDELDPYRVNVAFLVPYPGTNIYGELKASGGLKSESRSMIAGEKPVVGYEEFSPQEIALARRYLLDRSRGKEKFRRLLRNLRNRQFDKILDDMNWIVKEPEVSRRISATDIEK